MNINRWNLMGLALLALVLNGSLVQAAPGASPLTTNQISFARSGPRIFSRAVPVRLNFVSPRRIIKEILFSGPASYGNYLSINGRGYTKNTLRLNVVDAHRVQQNINYVIDAINIDGHQYQNAPCGRNTLFAIVVMRKEKYTRGSNRLTYWKDCAPPRVQARLKRIDGSIIRGNTPVTDNTIILEVKATDDQGVKYIKVSEYNRTGTRLNLLASRQFNHGLVRNAPVQFRLHVNHDNGNAPYQVYIDVNDWVHDNVHGARTSVGYYSAGRSTMRTNRNLTTRIKRPLTLLGNRH